MTSNSKAVALQMRKAEVQQNLRASFLIIESEIKRIGFNPMNLQGVHAPRIKLADKGKLIFQYDLNGNGRSFSVIGTGYDKDVAYADGNITPATDSYEVITIDLGSGDTDGDGTPEVPPASLMKATYNKDGNPYDLRIANNIETLNFVYLDKDGEPIKGSEPMLYPVLENDIPLIKKIQVSIVVRSSTARHDYVNTHNYINAQGQEILTAQDDGYDRAILTKTIDCRNLGLL